MPETAPSIVHLVAEAATGEAAAADQLLVKRYGRWTSLSRGDVLSRVTAAALGLRDAGLQPGAVVAMVMRPSTDRVVVDLALQLVGAVGVGIPTGMPEDQVDHVLVDSGARWVIVQNQHVADVVLPMVEEGDARSVERILYVDPAGVEDYASPLLASFAGLTATGARLAEADGGALGRLLDEVDADAVAAINYTSGRSGMPRGVLLTNRNLVAGTLGTIEALGLGPEDRVLSFRPLSDPVERTATLYPSLVSGAVLALPESRATAETAMWEIAPTYIHLTPRYVRTIADGIRVKMLAARNLKRLVTRRWLGRVRDAFEAGRPVSSAPLDRLLIGRPVLEKLGLDRATHVVVSGSRMSVEGIDFFHALGLPLRAGYSLTEAGGLAAVPRDDRAGRGTLGAALPGIETRIVDGELHLRGAALATHAHSPAGPVRLSDDDGWIATGDAAEERDGALAVRGRLGDMATLESGEQVNLTEVEAALLSSPYLREVVLQEDHGELVLTIEPAFDGVGRWATSKGIDYTTDRSLLAIPAVHELLDRAVEKALTPWTGLHIARTEVLVLPLAVADGTLTLAEDVRRHAVAARPTINGPTDTGELLLADARGTTGAR